MTTLLRPLLLSAVCLLALVATAPLKAADAVQPGDIDPTFEVGNGADQPIVTLAINPTNGVKYIGGRFVDYNDQGSGTQVARFAVLNPNGSLNTNWWNSIKDKNQPGANNLVNVVTLDNQGRVLVGGRFNTFYGKSIQHLVRLNPDGSLDETFNDGTIINFGPNDEVTSVHVTASDQVLVAGQFTQYNDGNQTLTRNQLVRLNADMSIDTSFDPGLGAESTSGSPIATMIDQPDGKILIGGDFERFQNNLVGRITRLNADGSLDTGFNSGGLGLSSGNIREIVLLPDGKIVAVGNIVKYNGIGTENMIRLNADGTLDRTFDPQVSAQIRSVERQADGKFLVVGDFRTVRGVSRPAAARVNADGTLDTDFNPGTGTLRVPEQPNRLDAVSAAKLDPNDDLVIVGDFTTWNGIKNVNHITRIATSARQINTNTAPLIVTNPQDVTVTEGDPYAFAVGASGTPPLYYQWKFNGVVIPGATNATYQDPSAALGEAGQYKVCVSNVVGQVESLPATLTVLPGSTAPLITSHPQSLTVTNGNPASFSVTASGSGPLFYFWKKNGVIMPGETNTTLVFAAAQVSDQATYKVCVSNSVAKVESNPATLTVITPAQAPTIITHPASRQVKVGSTVNFTVVAQGSPPLSYEWFFNGALMSGVTGPSVTLSGVATGSSGNYSVRVSNSAGSATSSNAVLAVLSPPVITLQPQSQTILRGGTLTLTVAATGTLPMGFQWKRNGVDLPGATSATLTIANVQAVQSGTYTVAVSNICAVVSSLGAAVTVGQPPAIVSQPQPLSVLVGQPAGFSVTVSGDGPCTYQWRKNGVDIPGATAANLAFAAARLSDDADYSVVVNCAFGTVISTSAHLTVNEAPRIVFNPISEVVIAGTNAVISADAVGTEPLTYQWYYEPTFTGQNAGTPVPNATGATLVFRDVAFARTGSYYCIAQNAFGSAVTRSASISVLSPPVLQSQPSSVSVNSGLPVGFTASATGTPDIAYQWFFNDQPIPGGTGVSIAFASVQTSQAGFYHLRATNLLGSATTAVVLLTVDGSTGGVSAVRTIQLPVVQSGILTVQFTTRDGQPASLAALSGLRVEGSSDLKVWSNVPAVISIVNGRFQMSLNDPSVLPYRFYRIVYP